MRAVSDQVEINTIQTTLAAPSFKHLHHLTPTLALPPTERHIEHQHEASDWPTRCPRAPVLKSVRLRLLLFALLPLSLPMPLVLAIARRNTDYDDMLIANEDSDFRIAEQFRGRIPRIKTEAARRHPAPPWIAVRWCPAPHP